MKQSKSEIKEWWDDFLLEGKLNQNETSQKISIKNAYNLFKKSVLNKLNKVSVLEIGSGTGIFTECMSREKKIKKLVCTDASSEAVKICKGKGFNAFLADAENLPFKDKSFDVVCGFAVLHHLNNPKKAIEEACRVSKNFVFFNEPNKWNPIRQLMQRFYYEKSAHETSYSIFQYRDWFKHSNFSVKIIPHDFIIPYFYNSFLVKLNVFMNKILNHKPINFIGSSLAIIAKSNENNLFKH